MKNTARCANLVHTQKTDTVSYYKWLICNSKLTGMAYINTIQNMADKFVSIYHGSIIMTWQKNLSSVLWHCWLGGSKGI